MKRRWTVLCIGWRSQAPNAPKALVIGTTHDGSPTYTFFPTWEQAMKALSK